MSNLHNSEDRWGFLRVVEVQVKTTSKSENVRVAQTAAKILDYLRATDPANGDVQGQGATEMRPSPLYLAERLTEHLGGAKVYMKRDELNHSGAHKINEMLDGLPVTLEQLHLASETQYAVAVRGMGERYLENALPLAE